MNRRFFIKLVGSAIIGTAIALKVPDSIVPTLKDTITSIRLNHKKHSHWVAQLQAKHACDLYCPEVHV